MNRHHMTANGPVPFTPEENSEWDAKEKEILSKEPVRLASKIRAERNTKIAECDWTQLPDAPVDKVLWATYRQELRDISKQAGFPWEVTWPTMPE